MEITSYLEWIGCVCGIGGALLQALNIRISAWGFALYMASNISWITAGYFSHTAALSVMNMAYTVTSAIGIYRWRKSMVIGRPQKQAPG